MRLLRNSLLVALVVALGALLVPAASMSGPIEDCADDGQLQGNYSNQQKQEALKNLPSDLSEYSDCGEILGTPNPSGPKSADGGSGGRRLGLRLGRRGRRRREHHRGGAGPAKPSAAELARQRRERAAIEGLANGAGKPNLELDGKSISPGDAGLYDLASATHEVPTPIKLSLLALALLTIAGLVLAARRRFPAEFDRLAGPVSNLGGRLARLRR